MLALTLWTNFNRCMPSYSSVLLSFWSGAEFNYNLFRSRPRIWISSINVHESDKYNELVYQKRKRCDLFLDRKLGKVVKTIWLVLITRAREEISKCLPFVRGARRSPEASAAVAVVNWRWSFHLWGFQYPSIVVFFCFFADGGYQVLALLVDPPPSHGTGWCHRKNT